jgi:hypothetical protein
VGWRVAASLHAELALGALDLRQHLVWFLVRGLRGRRLEMAIWSHCTDDLSSLVHHSARGIRLRQRITCRLPRPSEVRLWT